MEDSPQHAHVVVRKSNLKISHRRLTDYREFKKLRRQLQLKRHIKVQLCVKLSALQLFHVGNVYKIGELNVLSLYRHIWFSCREEKNERSSNINSSMKILRRLLADYVKNFHSKECHTCSTVVFGSVNQSYY